MDLSALNFEIVLPLIGAFFVFSFGIFIWLKSPRKPVNILFLGFCTAITYWLFGTFEMFLNRDNALAAVGWDRFVYIGVVFVPCLMHHFSLEITKNKGQRKLLAASYLFSFLFLFISQTHWFVDGLNVFPNLVHSRAMMGHHIFLVLFFADASLMFVNLLRAMKTADHSTRRAYIITMLAFLNILLIGGTAYLPAYGIDIGYPFSYFSGIIFVVLLSVAVTRYEFAESRILMTETFVFFVSLALTAYAVLGKSGGEIAFGLIMLVVFLYFGFNSISTMREEIARRKEVEAVSSRLQVANSHLRDMDEAKNEFLSIASHQLRTPVSVIKGYLSLIGEGAYGKVSGPISDKIDKMRDMNERLVQLINNLLDVSRIEKQRVEYDCRPTDIAALVRRFVEETMVRVVNPAVKLSFVEPSKLLPDVFVDASKVIEVIGNLIDNSIKFTERGHITISAEPKPQMNAVIVRISDTGPGMTDEEVEHAFEKFHHSRHDGNKANAMGVGIGLYICAKFLHGMGGDIWVDKTVLGQGTTIAISLPIKPTAECDKPTAAIEANK